MYEQDFGGSEYYDLFAIPSGGGAPVNLTNTPDISESNPLFSPDGKRIALLVQAEDFVDQDIALMDWKSRQVKKLTNETTKDHSWVQVDWSSDGQYIIANRMNIAFTDASVYRIEVAGGKAEELTPHKGDVLYSASSISPDGKIGVGYLQPEGWISKRRTARHRQQAAEMDYRHAMGGLERELSRPTESSPPTTSMPMASPPPTCTTSQRARLTPVAMPPGLTSPAWKSKPVLAGREVAAAASPEFATAFRPLGL